MACVSSTVSGRTLHVFWLVVVQQALARQYMYFMSVSMGMCRSGGIPELMHNSCMVAYCANASRALPDGVKRTVKREMTLL
jgi:hypothetical protein